MGWYGGQEGAARLRWHDQSRAAYGRFLGSVPDAKRTSFCDRVVDNRDRAASSMLVRNPMSQADLVAEVLAAAPAADDGGGWTVAVAASEDLLDLSPLNDVAGRITGLFLYGCGALDRASLAAFFSRLTNLESLTLVSCSPRDVYREDGLFLKTIFAGAMLPKLRVLETDAATDDTLAEMGTAPDLAALTFSYPSAEVTNDGLQRLVDAGGARELRMVAAGTLQKHLSKNLTKKYVAATLPQLRTLGEGRAMERLSHMAKGAKKKSDAERLREKYAADFPEDSRPFAVIPPARMTGGQLETALQRRGVTPPKFCKGYAEVLRALFLDGTVKWTHGEEQALQNREELRHLQEQLRKLREKAAAADGTVAKFVEGKLGRNKDKLYPLLCASAIGSALRETDVRVPRDCSKRRDDLAQVLHNSRYQGGGRVEDQLAHHRQVAAARHAPVAEMEGEIQRLRQQMALREFGSHAQGATAGSKRNIQLVS